MQRTGQGSRKMGTKDFHSKKPHPLHFSAVVPKKDGGQRPVINLKALNGFVRPEHFKMEGIPTLKDTGDWMAKVDLKDTYFTIPIHSNQRKYLRFVVTYKFNCLPFGLFSAPWVIIPRPSNQWQHCYGRQEYT